GGPRKAAPTALILLGRYVQPQHLSNFSTTEFRIDQRPNPTFPASSANVCLRGGEPSTDRESPTTSVTSNSPPRSRTQYRSGRTFAPPRSEEHTSELQSRENIVCRLLLD